MKFVGVPCRWKIRMPFLLKSLDYGSFYLIFFLQSQLQDRKRIITQYEVVIIFQSPVEILNVLLK